MLRNKKTKTLIITGIALLAMLILSLGLSQIKLQPGEKSNLNVDTTVSSDYGNAFNGMGLLYSIRAIYFLCFIILVGYIIYMLLTPERRKKLLRFLAWAVPTAIVGIILLTLIQSWSHNANSNNNITGPVTQPTSSLSAAPTASFTPNTSPVIIIVASVILAVIIGFLVFLLVTRFRREQAEQTNPLMRLADKAQATLDTLQAGGDIKNAVLRCYFDMNQILLEERGIKRSRSMTPREFEDKLLSNGLPGQAVSMLTRLFEGVRYGSKVPGKQEEEMAITSLTAIIDACKAEK